MTALTEDEAKAEFEPGSFGCHEALHMASFLANSVEDELTIHPTITANKEWLRLANVALNALSDLYQAIGAAHIPSKPE